VVARNSFVWQVDLVFLERANRNFLQLSCQWKLDHSFVTLSNEDQHFSHFNKKESRYHCPQTCLNTLAQALTGIAIQLEAAEESAADLSSQTLRHLNRARDLAKDSLAEVRRTILSLRPEPLEKRA